MGYTRGLNPEEEKRRDRRILEHSARPKKPWNEKKFEGRHVCAVCGEFIRTKRGEKAIRHEKKQIRLGINRKETFYTMRHSQSPKTGECLRK